MGLTNTPSDLLPGTLELLILKSLAGGAKHGYAIVEHLRAVLSTDIVLLLPISSELVVAAGSGAGFLSSDHAAAEALWARQSAHSDALSLPSGWQCRTLRSGRTNVALLATRSADMAGALKVSPGYLDSLLDQDGDA